MSGGGGSSSSGGGCGSVDSFTDRQFMVITSEKTARVIALPSQNCVYRQQITDTDYVVKAEIISLKGMDETPLLWFWVDFGGFFLWAPVIPWK